MSSAVSHRPATPGYRPPSRAFSFCTSVSFPTWRPPWQRGAPGADILAPGALAELQLPADPRRPPSAEQQRWRSGNRPRKRRARALLAGLGRIRSVCSFAPGSLSCVCVLVAVGVVFLAGRRVDALRCGPWNRRRGRSGREEAPRWRELSKARRGRDFGTPGSLTRFSAVGVTWGAAQRPKSCGGQRPRPDRQGMGLCGSLHWQGAQVAFRMTTSSGSGWGFRMGLGDVGVGVDVITWGCPAQVSDG